MKHREFSPLLSWIVLLVLIGGGAYLAKRQVDLQREIVELKKATSTPASRGSANPGGPPKNTVDTGTDLLVSRINALETALKGSQNEVAKLKSKLEEMAGAGRALGFAFRGAVAPDPGAPVKANTKRRRPWGPEQALGAPNTARAGDYQSAWAPLLRDAGEEWLQLDYENSVEISEVEVMESYNPGAISRVVAVLEGGGESTIWEGTMDPSNILSESVFQAPQNIRAKSIKVYLDTTRVQGWNEIDAVKLKGADGSEQWAIDSEASSSFAVKTPYLIEGAVLGGGAGRDASPRQP